MKKGTFSLCWIELSIRSGCLVVTVVTPMDDQQVFAKLHLKKRCAIVSLF
uniref:Uncharacterized protein n=1 Tax=Setaria viridis TaxID=4556 RepID=A0A4U6TLT1_SETVI|nr:hypothetical protein SEVIR_8G230140v2 [Setaria viridis]